MRRLYQPWLGLIRLSSRCASIENFLSLDPPILMHFQIKLVKMDGFTLITTPMPLVQGGFLQKTQICKIFRLEVSGEKKYAVLLLRLRSVLYFRPIIIRSKVK